MRKNTDEVLVYVVSCLYTASSSSWLPNTNTDVQGMFAHCSFHFSNSFFRAASWTLTTSAFCLDNMAMSPNCTFVIAFCKALTYQNPPCNGAAVCQTDLKGGGSVLAKQFRLGSYNSTIDPFINRFGKYEHCFHSWHVYILRKTSGLLLRNVNVHKFKLVCHGTYNPYMTKISINSL